MNVLFRPLAATVGTIALLAVEAFSAMLTYTILQLYSIDVFGYLVSLADIVLNLMVGWLQWLLPSTKNQQYATLVGELSPKAMLLLLIGLVVGALIRFMIWSVRRSLTRQH